MNALIRTPGVQLRTTSFLKNIFRGWGYHFDEQTLLGGRGGCSRLLDNHGGGVLNIPDLALGNPTLRYLTLSVEG